MRLRHFEALRPICPVCQGNGSESFRLEVAAAVQADQESIFEGALRCVNPHCQREYPIIDGIPLIIAPIRAYIADNIQQIFARSDLSALSESMLGDCCGQGAPFDTMRQHLSCYAWDHYADLDPAETEGEPAPGSAVRLLAAGWEMFGRRSPGPVLDIGCSVGRTSLALAQKQDQLVLGVDLNFSMLRLAADVMRTGKVRYPRRRVGIVYDRREFSVSLPHMDRVDVWACDATAPPFADQTFGLATGFNVLDSVQSPLNLLHSIARVVRPGGGAILGCPYDWSVAATPVENWLGGHSQRGPDGGACEPVLRSLLTPAAHPSSLSQFKLLAERGDLPWHVRLHDRSSVSYQVHLIAAERDSTAHG